MFAWRRGAIRAAIEKYTPLMMLIEPAAGSELALAAAYDRIHPISIDHAVMEGAAGDHRVVMGSMDVGWSDLGSWSALLAGARRPRRPHAGRRRRHERSRRSSRARRSTSAPMTCSSGPMEGRLAVEAPAGDGSCRTASPPTSPAPASSRPRSGRSSTASRSRRSELDEHRRGRRPRRRSSSAPTAGGRRSPTTTRSTTSAAAPTASPATSSTGASRPRASSSPTTGGSPRSTSPPPAAEVLLAHDIPVAFAVHAVPTQMSSYEVVQRGAAAGIVITASHNPWTDNGFKVKAPTGAAAGPEILDDDRGADRRATAGRRSSDGRSPTPRRPASSSASTRSRATRRSSAAHVDLDSLKAADITVLVDPMYGAGAGWIPRLLAGGRIRVTEIHQERNPYFGGINPEPIRPHIDEALGILAKGGYDLGLLLDGDADRAGRGRREGHVHPPAPGHRPADVLPRRAPRPARAGRRQRQQHLDGGPARRALRDRDARDAGRLQVHRAEDDRDRGDDGRRGVGRLRLRDASARARRHLRRPHAARPLPPGEGRRPLAGVEGDRALPRDRRAVVLPADRRPRAARRVSPRSSGASSSTSSPTPRPSWPAGR